jgi:hypothetical protein
LEKDQKIIIDKNNTFPLLIILNTYKKKMKITARSYIKISLGIEILLYYLNSSSSQLVFFVIIFVKGLEIAIF